MIRDIRFEPSQIYGSMQRPFWGFFAFSYDDSIQGPHVTRRTINQRNHAGSSISNRSDCLGKVAPRAQNRFRHHLRIRGVQEPTIDPCNMESAATQYALHTKQARQNRLRLFRFRTKLKRQNAPGYRERAQRPTIG